MVPTDMGPPQGSKTPSITVPLLQSRKVALGGVPISAITAYDYTFARLFDASGVDIILVGDSVASIVQGHTTTLPVTLDEMVYHCRCVARGVSRALVVGDMPFMSYQASPEQALMSAGRLLKEGGVAAVKLEGGVAIAETIRRLAQVDIPVVGHVGLTPQSYHRMGGHRMQGKKRGGANAAGSAEQILADAVAVAEAGAFLLVVEGVPAEVAQEITAAVSIPVIGIGAGPHCDGQILVGPDLLGLNPDFKPRFLKRFAELGNLTKKAVSEFVAEVQQQSFPAAEHSVFLGAKPEAILPAVSKSPKVSKLKMVRR
jgi:3-methyl-2-oxobutanoate hydroxymethyltransferase